jgi:hypothetical protein
LAPSIDAIDFFSCVEFLDSAGTDACPDRGHQFHCYSGARARIHVSFVNDGICDCEDGSDEFEERSPCGAAPTSGKKSSWRSAIQKMAMPW